MTEPFQLFELRSGCLSESCDNSFPTYFHAWNESPLVISNNATHFGFVSEGRATIETDFGTYELREMMYFCVPGNFTVSGGAGVIISRLSFRGVFMLGGPIEEAGRLRYIDGCRDTLLIPPTLKGDPCLNALYFPKSITQTPHTHPSVRVGVVARGRGECVTNDAVYQLKTGSAFVIAPEALHSFNTNDSEMVVIAYHPDSDFGATHEDHPMVNRTMVDGISAAQIDDIRTKGDVNP